MNFMLNLNAGWLLEKHRIILKLNVMNFMLNLNDDWFIDWFLVSYRMLSISSSFSLRRRSMSALSWSSWLLEASRRARASLSASLASASSLTSASLSDSSWARMARSSWTLWPRSLFWDRASRRASTSQNIPTLCVNHYELYGISFQSLSYIPINRTRCWPWNNYL